MNVLILGATGTLGSAARQELLNQTDANLTLFSRSADRLTVDPKREKAISGDLTNGQELDAVMEGQDVVFAALSGNLKRYAQSIVESMDRNHVQRLIFISSMGIYDEIPASVGSRGNLKYNSVLRPYREAADVIEASDLNYTVIRPGWFTGGPVNYEVTHKGEPFGGHDVSINSIADLVLKLVNDNQLYSKESVEINTPA